MFIVFLVAVACGVVAFSLTFDALHPRPKPPPPTIPDVWETLAKAQRTVDYSLRLVRDVPI